MRLIELELTNIKSYKHEIIKFSEGINCILGLNGSGKSTIIESIGSALFNYNQRTTNELLRYNETKGQISLLFEGNDNKLYKIIKTLRNKGNSNIKIIDEENQETLQETVSDVYEFVKRVLNVPKEKTLSKMYEEIIAVPQGAFVNAFLETPKKRKENLDKLFELDIYKKLADELKILSDKVQKEYIFITEKDIASIDGKLTDYELKKENKEQLVNQIKEHQENYNNIDNIYNKKSTEKKVLEVVFNDLEENSKNKIALEKDISNTKNQINIYKESLINSKEARKTLNNNEFGYNLYKKTNEELKANENIYNIHLELENKLNQNKSEISKLEQSNKYINDYIYDKKKESGKYKEHVLDKQEEIEKNKEEIKSIEEEIIPLRQEVNKKETLKTETQARYTFYLNKLNNINTYLLTVNFKDNTEENNIKIKTIEEKLQKISQNKEEIIELDKKKIKLVSDLENLNSNNIYINDGLCPILKQKCLNIKESSLSNEIQKIIEDKEKELLDINRSINLLIVENKYEDEFIKEKELLLLDINNVARQKDKYISVIDDLESTFSHENIKVTFENDKEVVKELIKKYENLKNNFDDVELKKLKEKELKMSNTIFSLHNMNNINGNIIKEDNKKIEEISLDLIKKEQEYKRNNNDISKFENDNKLITMQLDQNKDIKQKIEDNKKVLEKYFNNYNLYVSKQNEAANLEKYEKLVYEFEESFNKSNKQLQELEQIIASLTQKVSKEKLNQLIEEVNKLEKDLSVIKNTINIKNTQLEILEKELEILEKLVKEREEKEKQLDKYYNLDNKYKLYRTIFNNLPKELSKQIRKYISIYASNLYRKISNENVRIDLLDDYEVILVDCIDQNKQKTLSQLSGGEQMSVAIAIRLAMLKQITNISFYFMDEPTINLDTERRMMVGEVVKDISQELNQLFVISHDDTFESITDNNIKIIKNNNISILDN